MSTAEEEIPKRCETDGCHRTATHRMVYEVWRNHEVQYEIRGTCLPCTKAMEFRETFPVGNDSWKLEKVR